MVSLNLRFSKARRETIRARRSGGNPRGPASRWSWTYLKGRNPVRSTLLLAIVAIALGLAPGRCRAAIAHPSGRERGRAFQAESRRLRKLRTSRRRCCSTGRAFRPARSTGATATISNMRCAVSRRRTRSPRPASSTRRRGRSSTAKHRARADRIHDHREGRERPVRRRNPGEVRGQGEAEAARLHQRRRDAGGALPHGRDVSGGTQSRQGFRQGRHGDCRCEHQREAGRTAKAGCVEGRQDPGRQGQQRRARAGERRRADCKLSGLDRQRRQARAVRHAESRRASRMVRPTPTIRRSSSRA